MLSFLEGFGRRQPVVDGANHTETYIVSNEKDVPIE